MTQTVDYINERRLQLQRDAGAKGIDEEYVSCLVDTFYERIRTHQELGPIFDDVIKDNWAFHLERMKRFWVSVALHKPCYSGNPVPAHQKLEGVSAQHFATWLQLFRETLNDTAPSPEAVEHFMERAERIARSLQLAMFVPSGFPAAEGNVVEFKSV
ncbi:MAG: group III truncated hemoglobin [Pseudomonadales bacterium]|nr:group III truncated hemoglobin [Pseudomonadales bacterium]MCP5343876.1 group III truncated hemoglobin [Pseudomonadales bacterium]